MCMVVYKPQRANAIFDRQSQRNVWCVNDSEKRMGDVMNEIINLENIKVPSVNQKYGYNPQTKRAFVNREYTQFKKLLTASAVKMKVEPPYYVLIEKSCYIDIDNDIKIILDSLEDAGVIENDRSVLKLQVIKEHIAKKSPGYLRVYVAHYVD